MMPSPLLSTRHLMTRRDLLDDIRSCGFTCPETTLVYWEKQGLLPRAIRRWQDGKPAALYSDEMAALVVAFCDLRQCGYGLADAARLAPLSPLVRYYRTTPPTFIPLKEPSR